MVPILATPLLLIGFGIIILSLAYCGLPGLFCGYEGYTGRTFYWRTQRNILPLGEDIILMSLFVS